MHRRAVSWQEVAAAVSVLVVVITGTVFIADLRAAVKRLEGDGTISTDTLAEYVDANREQLRGPKGQEGAQGERGPSGRVGPQGPSDKFPIGTILAWHPKLFGITDAVLPNGWVRCSGQKNVPLGNNRTVDLPNLNGEGRFLRGGKESGISQGDSFRSHNHGVSDPGHNHSFIIKDGDGGARDAPADGDRTPTNTISTSSNGTGVTINNAGGNETRPINMSVVWIIRVK